MARLLAGTFLGLVVLIVACGGDGTPSPVTSAGPPTQPPVTETAASSPSITPAESATPRTPAQIGSDILGAYEQLLADATALLQSEPSAAALRVPLGQLRVQYIDTFVGLGWERWALDAAGRAEVDRAAAIL